MGFKLFTSQEFKVCPNQEVEIMKPIELVPENRGVVHGIVHKCGHPAKDCVVKLFKKECEKYKGVGFTYTDCFGQFLFPVCDTNVPLILKVFCLHEDCKQIDLKSGCQEWPLREEKEEIEES
ncbi:MAG: hypothetical protein GX154_12920 [Clostridiales bacterium]|nr:hypothetical protein [Clostridiales bacterium]